GLDGDRLVEASDDADVGVRRPPTGGCIEGPIRQVAHRASGYQRRVLAPRPFVVSLAGWRTRGWSPPGPRRCSEDGRREDRLAGHEEADRHDDPRGERGR